MNVADIIARAGFDEHDLDIATSGLCATFALALLDTLETNEVSAQAALACVGPATQDPMDLLWRHVVVVVGGRHFDVEGEVLPEHVLENYCWGSLSSTRTLVPLSRDDFLRVIHGTRNAFDEDRLVRWTARLRAAAGKFEEYALPC